MIKKGDLYFPSQEFKRQAWINDEKIYQEAAKEPIKFWEKLAEEIYWRKKWTKAFEHNPPYFKWFSGGKLNITENIFDKYFEDNSHGRIRISRGRRPSERFSHAALIWEPEPPAEEPRILTYKELFKEVNKFANALKKLGVKKGDRVVIYLPMISEVVISMLACARLGAVHTVVFSAFSPVALRIRLQDTEAKILITADGYYRRGQVINLKANADAALGCAEGEPRPDFKSRREGIKPASAKATAGEETKVEKVIVVKRAGNEISWQEGKDFWYEDLIKNENDFCEPEVMDSEDPLFILYTSGSTGRPKGILHTSGGYTVQAKFTGRWIFDFHNEDIFWCTSDVGWITGHTYTIYSPLLNGVTTLIFEGAPDWPSPDRWAQIIEKYKVTIFYTAPTAIRMFEKYGAEVLKKHKFKTLRLLGSVGEPFDEGAWNWYFKEVGKEKCPIVDTWWQTETGGILITSLPGVGPFKPTFTGLPFPGVMVDVFDDKGKSCVTRQKGNLVILLPFAPGMLRGIYKDPKKYEETYWSQYGSINSPQAGKIYFTSDAAYKDENGLIRILGRVDDVIKVAGHRIATGELENAINLHPEISESAVIGVPDEIKGEVPMAFVVYQGAKTVEEIKREVADQVKKEIGPIALPKEVYLVDDLPKTRSGKIMRRILKRIFTGEELGDLSTLANLESVEKIKKIIQS